MWERYQKIKIPREPNGLKLIWEAARVAEEVKFAPMKLQRGPAETGGGVSGAGSKAVGANTKLFPPRLWPDVGSELSQMEFIGSTVCEMRTPEPKEEASTPGVQSQICWQGI